MYWGSGSTVPYILNLGTSSYETILLRLFEYLTMISFCRIISGGEKHYSRNRAATTISTPSCCLHALRFQNSRQEFQSGRSANNSEMALCFILTNTLLELY